MKCTNLVKTIFVSFATAVLFILPDYLYQFVNDSFFCSDRLNVLKLIIPLGLGLATNKYKALTIICVALFFLLQLMQFSHISYFGNQLSPYDFYSLATEFGDVIQESGNAFFAHWKAIMVVVVPFALIVFLLRIKTIKSIFGTIVLLTTLPCIYYFNCFVRNCAPNEFRFTIDNSLKSFSSYIETLFRNYHPNPYIPYDVKNIGVSDQPITVVYILGESANYGHMSLFGYERDTTPMLRTLSKMDNFYYTKGVAGGTCTKSSCKFMMNVICEPDNVKLAYGDDLNLFKLAKTNGFKTFYISDQLEGLMTIISGRKYIDKMITPSRDQEFDKETDSHLITLLKKQELSNRNFIVLHQRCVHTPYSQVFGSSFTDRNRFSGSKNPVIDEYDNAMVYNDYVISRIFNHFNKVRNGKFYIIWASDHNEFLGEDGLFGHGHLIGQCADIPVIVQSNDTEFMNKLRSIFKPTHYEIAKNIATLLGYEIKNPNEEKNIFYISGSDFNGKCGHIKLKKDPINNKVEYFIKR